MTTPSPKYADAAQTISHIIPIVDAVVQKEKGESTNFMSHKLDTRGSEDLAKMTLAVINSRPRNNDVTAQYKFLQFDEVVSLQYIQHANDLDRDTFRSIYYNSNDYLKFKKEAKRTVENCKKNIWSSPFPASSSLTLCPRGLERHMGSKRDKQKRKERLLNLRRVVLQEHAEQKRLGIHDPIFLSNLYQDLSKNSITKAHKQAQRDHEEALWDDDFGGGGGGDVNCDGGGDIPANDPTSPDKSSPPTSKSLTGSPRIRIPLKNLKGIRAMIPGMA